MSMHYKIFKSSNCIVVTLLLAACQSPKQQVTQMDNQTTQNKVSLQDSTARLLSIAAIQPDSKGLNATVKFFETPQIFELPTDTDAGKNLLKLLQEADKQHLPVNVLAQYGSQKNEIVQVSPANEAQVKIYNETKANNAPATPVNPNEPPKQ